MGENTHANKVTDTIGITWLNNASVAILREVIQVEINKLVDQTRG